MVRTVSIVGLSLATAALLLGLPGSGVAAPAATSLPFGAHGDSIGGSSGAPVALTGDSFLVCAEGADGTSGTADDVTLLVTNAGGTPVITALTTPYLSIYSGGITRVTATRALVAGGGPDTAFESADDVVYLLDGLGTTNTVTPIAVGPLSPDSGHVPVMLTPTTAVIATGGVDETVNSADDTLALISGLGTTNTVTQLPAPGLDFEGGTLPVRLTATSLLISSTGPDNNDATADDVVYLFTGVGTTNTRTDLATPFLPDFGRPARPVKLTDTRALVSSSGPDAVMESADDRIILLDNLGTTNNVTPIPVPYIFDYGAGQATRIADDVAVVATWGADATDQTADDGIAVLTGLGTTNTVTQTIVGPLDEDRECQSVRLSDTSLALATFGPDLSIDTADDEIAIVSNVGGTNTVSKVNVAGIGGQSTSTISRIDSTSIMVSSGGANGNLSSGGDDIVSIITGIGGVPSTATVSADIEHGSDSSFQSTPHLLGGGLAVFVNPGADASEGDGDDDVMRIISDVTNNHCAGLPRTNCEAADKAGLNYKDNADPTKRSLKFKFKGTTDHVAADFGAPNATTTHSLCLYENGEETIASLSLPAGGSGWSAVSDKGFKYKDTAAAGFQGAKLKAGNAAKPKASKVKLKGKGAGVPSLTLPLVEPVVAQEINDSNGICYEGNFPTAILNDAAGGKYKAKQ